MKGAGFGNAVSPKRGGGGGQAIRAWRHGMKGAVGGRGGGRGGGGGLFGDSGEREDGGWVRGGDGRPSIGTWNKTQNYLQILKELSGKVRVKWRLVSRLFRTAVKRYLLAGTIERPLIKFVDRKTTMMHTSHVDALRRTGTLLCAMCPSWL